MAFIQSKTASRARSFATWQKLTGGSDSAWTSALLAFALVCARPGQQAGNPSDRRATPLLQQLLRIGDLGLDVVQPLRPAGADEHDALVVVVIVGHGGGAL